MVGWPQLALSAGIVAVLGGLKALSSLCIAWNELRGAHAVCAPPHTHSHTHARAAPPQVTIARAIGGCATLVDVAMQARALDAYVDMHSRMRCCAFPDAGAAHTRATARVQFNSFSDPGATALASALAGHTALASLNISYNRVHATGAEAVTELLRAPGGLPSLRLLEANGNPVGDAAAALAEACAGRRHFVRAYLEGCASDGLRGAPVPAMKKPKRK